MRRLSLIPATLAILVLAACSKDNASSSDSASAGGASAAAGSIDTWRIVGPLVAGAQASDCGQMERSNNQPGTVLAIGADGKLTGSGVDTDMSKPRSVQLIRERNGDAFKVSAILTTDPEKGPTLGLNDDGSQGGASATLMAGDKHLYCTRGTPLARMRAEPLYKLMAQVLEAPPPKLSCMNLSTKLSSSETAFKVANGIVTLGADTFDLSRAKQEQLLLALQDDVVSYIFELPGKPMIILAYDASGKLKGVQGGSPGDPTHACQTEG